MAVSIHALLYQTLILSSIYELIPLEGADSVIKVHAVDYGIYSYVHHLCQDRVHILLAVSRPPSDIRNQGHM